MEKQTWVKMSKLYQSKLDELWKQNLELKCKLITKNNIEEEVKKMLLHSSISIQDCEKIFKIITLEERI